MSRKHSCAAVLAGAIAVSLGSGVLSPVAHAADLRGTEFWLFFFPNELQPRDEEPRDIGLRHVYVTADADTTGTLWTADPRGDPIGVPYSQDFEVAAGSTTLIDLDAYPFTGPIIRVTTDNEAVVDALNWASGSADGFAVFPADALGKEHLVMTVHHTGVIDHQTGNYVGVIGTVDGTQVTILRRRDAYPDDPPYTITLDRGERFWLSYFTDLSGTEVVADQPVAVFSANRCASIPGEGDPGAGAPPPDDPIEADPGSCSHLVEQVPPTRTWGRLFYLAPLAERPDGYVARVLAKQDGTGVSINGVEITLDRGQVHKQIVQGPAEIVADAPVLVAQLITGRQRDEDYERTIDHHAAMMLVPPYGQFLDEYLITTPPENLYAFHYVNLIAPTAAAGGITIDGAAVPAERFEPIGSSGFSGAQVPIAPGTHTLAGSLPFSAAVYGYQHRGADNKPSAYSYPGGMSLSGVATVTSVALEPQTATHTIGNPGCIGASVVDAQAQAVENIRVDFAVTGANPSLAHDRTDADGIASYCYAGMAVGQDRIVASVSTFEDSANKTWIAAGEQSVAGIRFRPDSISCQGRGLRQVQVFGSAEFDVRQIVPASLRLEREDGTGNAVGPPRHHRLRDAGGPDSGYRRDGFVDANMRFDAAKITQLIDCSQLSGAQSPPLLVTGQLQDGTTFETDSATLTLRGRR